MVKTLRRSRLGDAKSKASFIVASLSQLILRYTALRVASHSLRGTTLTLDLDKNPPKRAHQIVRRFPQFVQGVLVGIGSRSVERVRYGSYIFHYSIA
jgi:hypothetical protein